MMMSAKNICFFIFTQIAYVVMICLSVNFQFIRIHRHTKVNKA